MSDGKKYLSTREAAVPGPGGRGDGPHGETWDFLRLNPAGPDGAGGPASPFWDIPMLTCALAADEPPLMDLTQAAGATLSGLRLDGGALVLRVERGGAAVELRLRDAEVFPEGVGIELRHGVLGLPQTMRRERDLWNLLDGPVPPPGWCGAAGTGRWRGRWGRILPTSPTARPQRCCGARRRLRTGTPTTRCAAGSPGRGAHEGRLSQAAAEAVTSMRCTTPPWRRNQTSTTSKCRSRL
ncbi:MAG: hypothetical protein OXQ29_25235 [Rhodospirillaceae bacterium]|nr:hypothetical protein [Rhodospirillaceae bacterium]